MQERDDLLRPVAAALELDAAVHVFGVLAEDHHVDLVGAFVRRLDALEILHRADAGIEVEADAQIDVDAAEAAADGRGERPFEAEAVILERLERVVGQIELALFLLAERARPARP